MRMMISNFYFIFSVGQPQANGPYELWMYFHTPQSSDQRFLKCKVEHVVFEPKGNRDNHFIGVSFKVAGPEIQKLYMPLEALDMDSLQHWWNNYIQSELDPDEYVNTPNPEGILCMFNNDLTWKWRPQSTGPLFLRLI